MNKDLFLEGLSIAHKDVLMYEEPYFVLANIKNIINDLVKNLDDEYYEYTKDVYVHKTAIIDENVKIIGPCIIDANSEIRFNAFIRGNVIIGKNCVIGNSCELKNSIIYDNCQIPHFNYVGDSLLGNHVHLGAGVILSNLKSDKKNVMINNIDTKLRKVGSFLGDNVEIGCNSVLNPGTIIYPNSRVYPLTNVRGIINSNKIVKDMQNIVDIK